MNAIEAVSLDLHDMKDPNAGWLMQLLYKQFYVFTIWKTFLQTLLDILCGLQMRLDVRCSMGSRSMRRHNLPHDCSSRH
jgi:hypothetical protein